MKRIFKYKLEIMDDPQEIIMPSHSRILSVIEQNGKPVLYALVEDEREEQLLNVKIVGTGHPFEYADKWDFVDTVKCGAFVWHVFVSGGF